MILLRRLMSFVQVNRQIVKDEEEKAKIQNDLRMLTERLSRVNDSVARKVASRNESVPPGLVHRHISYMCFCEVLSS
jgi:uncharacterized coiled-coil protein SlyX